MKIYVIYEMNSNTYWAGGRNFESNVQNAMRLKSIGEAKAAINGLYRSESNGRYSVYDGFTKPNRGYNLIYRKMYQG